MRRYIIEISMFLRVTLILCISVLLNGCDSPTGYEKSLSDSKEWPQEIVGTFYFLDSDLGDGTYAEWAIGTFEPLGTSESILVEFNGNTLKNAGIDLSFEFPKPVTFVINQPHNMYFQVEKIVN